MRHKRIRAISNIASTTRLLFLVRIFWSKGFISTGDANAVERVIRTCLVELGRRRENIPPTEGDYRDVAAAYLKTFGLISVALRVGDQHAAMSLLQILNAVAVFLFATLQRFEAAGLDGPTTNEVRAMIAGGLKLQTTLELATLSEAYRV